MFGSTLALCLVGALMVFSASAVTARDQYGNGSHFLLRQLLWLAFGLGGMMAVMNLDYRKLRRPAVIFTILFAGCSRCWPASSFSINRTRRIAGFAWARPACSLPKLAKLAVIFYLALMVFSKCAGGPRDSA